MEITEAIKLAEEALRIVEQRIKFVDCYEQTVGFVAEAIKAAVEAETVKCYSFEPTPNQYTGE